MGDARSNCLIAIQPVLQQIEENKLEKIKWEEGSKEHNIKKVEYNLWLNSNANIDHVKVSSNSNKYEVMYKKMYNEWESQRVETPDCGGRHKRDETHCQNQAKIYWNNEGWEFDKGSSAWCGTASSNRKLHCKRSVDGIQILLNDYKEHVKPIDPGDYGSGPTMIVNNAATCCEQIFKDITVTGGGNNDINAVQNCSAKLSMGGQTDEGTNADEDDFDDSDITSKDKDDKDDNTFWYLLFGGGTTGIISSSCCCCFVFILIIIFIM
jgi:hypothetical protein